MFKDYRFLCSEINKGKSVLRAFLNLRLSEETLKGKTIDIGGGKNADYISFMKKSDDVDFLSFDIKSGATVDFEKDRLPAGDDAFDTVLFLNVMEHIFNYQHIANEVFRITKPGGQLIGFVPFLMWYHADHRDFFRYTHESIENIFHSAGAKSVSIEVVGAGPFIAASHMFILSLPRLVRPIAFTINFILDELYQKLKGKNSRPYALGYYFIINKDVC